MTTPQDQPPGQPGQGGQGGQGWQPQQPPPPGYGPPPGNYPPPPAGYPPTPPGYGPPQQGGYPPPPPGYGPPQQGGYPPPGYGPPQGGYQPPSGGGGAGFSVAAIKAAYADARPPKEVHQAFLLLVAALAVGLLSDIIGLVFAITLVSGVTGSGGAIVGTVIILLVRLIVYAAVIYVGIMMRAGKQWARITIAVLAGLAALLSLFGLLGALLFSFFAGFAAIVGFVVSLVQLTAAVGILILMFRPHVNSYFN